MYNEFSRTCPACRTKLRASQAKSSTGKLLPKTPRKNRSQKRSKKQRSHLDRLPWPPPGSRAFAARVAIRGSRLEVIWDTAIAGDKTIVDLYDSGGVRVAHTEVSFDLGRARIGGLASRSQPLTALVEIVDSAGRVMRHCRTSAQLN